MLFPVNLRFGPDGGLNAALPAAGADNGEGVILRLDPATAGAIQMPAGPPPASDCAPITPPPPPPVTPRRRGRRRRSSPPRTRRPRPARWETVAVSLMEFAIDMPSELPAGPTTFEITNDGTIEHNFEVEVKASRRSCQRTRPGRNHAHGGPGAWHLRGLPSSREPRG